MMYICTTILEITKLIQNTINTQNNELAANVIAAAKNVKCLSIHRSDFEQVLGHIEDRIETDRKAREEHAMKLIHAPVAKTREEFKARVQSVHQLDVLNDGAFTIGGQLMAVRACREHDQDLKLTLKSWSKDQVVESGQVANALNETKILKNLVDTSVHLPALVHCFTDPTHSHLHAVFATDIIADVRIYKIMCIYP